MGKSWCISSSGWPVAFISFSWSAWSFGSASSPRPLNKMRTLGSFPGIWKVGSIIISFAQIRPLSGPPALSVS
eukprot:4759216-Pyramimonas_sp.AAC.1